MNVPEIRLYIAQHLYGSELVALAAVNKEWYSTCIPLIYTSHFLYWKSKAQPPEKIHQAFQNHATYVRRMYISSERSPKVKIRSLYAFTSLETLDFHLQTHDEKLWKYASRLVRQNPGLQTVDISFASGGCVPFPSLSTFSSYCPRLKTFSIHTAELNINDVEQFLRESCNRLETLIMDNVFFTDTSRPLTDHSYSVNLQLPPKFPRISKFRITGNISLTHTLEIFKRCPRLTVIKKLFHTGNIDFPADSFYEVLEGCPLITKLKLDFCRLSDTEFAKAIDSCQSGLKSASFYRTSFGSEALQSLLGRHAHSLTTLNMESRSKMASAMTMQILTSCPNLRIFTGSVLKAQDILGITDGGESATEQDSSPIQPQEWVCRDIRSFRVFICGFLDRPAHWQRLVMQRLATLDKIESLCVGSDYAISSYPEKDRDGLDLRLAAGMYVLSSLKKLNYLSFSPLEMNMDEEDVRWMAVAWPNLTDVHGGLNHDSKKAETLGKLLKNVYIMPFL